VLQIDLLIVNSCSVLDFFSSRFGGGSGESGSVVVVVVVVWRDDCGIQR
jgi:hypothetical protein